MNRHYHGYLRQARQPDRRQCSGELRPPDAGPDGIFGTADDIDYSLTPIYEASTDTVTLRATVPGNVLPVGLYQFTIIGTATSGIHDLSGNLLDGDENGTAGGSYIRTFSIGLPAAPTNLAITPDTGVSSTDGLTDTGSITVSGSLAEGGLFVDVYDATTSTDLGKTAVSGTTFDIPLALAEGTHQLLLRASDGLGETSAQAPSPSLLT